MFLYHISLYSKMFIKYKNRLLSLDNNLLEYNYLIDSASFINSSLAIPLLVMPYITPLASQSMLLLLDLTPSDDMASTPLILFFLCCFH